MSSEKTAVGESYPVKDPIFSLWKIERQVAEQLRRGVRILSGAEVAVSVGSSMFTYVRRNGNELIIKYIDGCVVITAYAKLAGEEAKVYNVTAHNICSKVDL
jgi:hypothetical protein